MRSKRSVLVADSDPAFLDSLAGDPKTAQMPIVVAKTGREAQLALADKEKSFAGIFISLDLPLIPGISVLRFAHQSRPATPLHVIVPKDGRRPDLDERRLGLEGFIEKPFTYSELLSRVAPAAFFFDPSAVLAHAGKAGETLDAEFSAEDEGFVSIRADDFISGSKSYFDLYVRLAEKKYVKILQAGDSFSPDRLKNYLEKGVEHFYLKKEVQEQYLAYCDELTAKMLGHGAISSEAKLSATLNHGQETINFLRSHGISETNLQYAENFVANTQKLVQALHPGKQELLKGFMADVASYEHGVATTVIASLMLPGLKIVAEKPVQIVGIAGLFHDLGLYGMPEAVQDEDESKMTAEQVALYHTHPAVGAEKLRQIHGIDPAVTQAVAQHHERRNKRGFPARLGTGTINRVAELIGVADDFVRLIKRAQENPKIGLLREMELQVFPGFSPPIVDTFRTVFFPAQTESKPKPR